MANEITTIGCFDFHIHTKHLKCANETMEIAAIVKECERLGIVKLGITDHLNALAKLELHRLIRNDIERIDTEVEIFFGVELNFLSMDGPFAFSEAIKEEYGFQFVIGGIHSTYVDTYDLKKIVDVQHRHHLKTCRDPLVDVLVHPYWLWKGEFDAKGWPWLDAMPNVPESYARELGQVARETATAIEINASSIFTSSNDNDRYIKEYIEFLQIVAAEGACFSMGSDAHDIAKLKNVQQAWEVAKQLRLPADRIWTPKGTPMTGGIKI